MKNIKLGIKLLKALQPGYYKCLREVERDDYSSPRINKLDMFIFVKYLHPDGSGCSYNTIGSDYPYDEEELLTDCYNDFSPLFNIELINKPVETTNEQPKDDRLNYPNGSGGSHGW